ncbi:MAG: tyrosine--tRNA ligase [Tenericutes bacterium]|nr:tyrosine--tRNA ligase [Mycoplasmatota bacterium]MDD6387662.1 tyrosine--tRNA ligase [Bacilli bacterium]MDY3801863.1 tyrosine--tRNA ligase [Bacilli bacterium]
MTLWEELNYRGLVKDVAGEDIGKKLDNEKISFYWGTDPTADSLHIGHYSSLVTAKRLANAGHKPILLVGGATGLIGDPRPTAEREIISYEKLNENKEKLKKQVKKLVGENVEVVDNYDWTKEFDYITFLRDIGKYINVNYMLNKDIIARRLESGITYAEFSYTLIQGNDFLHLFENKNCSMQVAGSDQWGNITTGIDLIRKKTGKEAYGFTMPLVLDANGNKFGKSEGNALWLDIEKTSSYELYQYLINASDELVEDYLKIFTFFTKEEIENIMKKHLEHPELRTAQKTLGHEIVKDIHGLEEANRAVKISEALFSGNVKDLTEKEINDVFKGAPSIEIEGEMTLLDLLVNNNIASSRREAREFLSAGSITINGDKFQDESQMITKDLAIGGHTMIIRRGKKKQFVVKFK